MADIVDPKTRSRMMAGIRGKNTKPEIVVRSGLHKLGFRFRLHAKEVPGRPDLFLRKYRASVFVHGCFWHGHNCPLFKVPETRPEFWQSKIAANRARDAIVRQQTFEAGLRHLTIWECALRGRGRLEVGAAVNAAADWLRGAEMQGELRGLLFADDGPDRLD